MRCGGPLFTRAGVRLGDAAGRGTVAFDHEGVLIAAMGAGRFAAPDLEAAMETDFIGDLANGIVWKPVASPSRDRFQLRDLGQEGPENGAFASYFSFWIRSPRAPGNLLADAPDAPCFAIHCYVSGGCRLFVNSKVHESMPPENADYLKLLTYDGILLKKGWNRCVIKVVSDSLVDPNPATLAVRISSNRPEYLRQLDSAVEHQLDSK